MPADQLLRYSRIVATKTAGGRGVWICLFKYPSPFKFAKTWALLSSPLPASSDRTSLPPGGQIECEYPSNEAPSNKRVLSFYMHDCPLVQAGPPLFESVWVWGALILSSQVWICTVPADGILACENESGGTKNAPRLRVIGISSARQIHIGCGSKMGTQNSTC